MAVSIKKKPGKNKAQSAYILKNKDDQVVCTINRAKRKGQYVPVSNAPSQEYLSKISLSGFTSLPAGLRRSGFGLTTVGYLVLKALSEQLGRFELTVDKDAATAINKAGKSSQVVIKHADLLMILSNLRRIGAQRYQDQIASVGHSLFGHFPKIFKKPKEGPAYRPGDLTAILLDKSALKHLSPKDVDTLRVPSNFELRRRLRSQIAISNCARTRNAGNSKFGLCTRDLPFRRRRSDAGHCRRTVLTRIAEPRLRRCRTDVATRQES